MPSHESFFHKIGKEGVKWNQRIDVLTGVIGAIVGSAPVVAYAIISWLAGREVGKWLDKKQMQRAHA